MKALIPLVLIMSFLCGCVGPDLNHYRKWMAPDSPSSSNDGVKVTYLGVNGYLIESAQAVILVDPYFTRIPFLKYISSHHLEPDLGRIDWGLQHIPKHVDLILVTHAHPDHLFDAPQIAKIRGARLVASPTACNIVRSLHTLNESQIVPILTTEATTGQTKGIRSQTRRFGAVKIEALETEHDRLIGIPLFPGNLYDVPKSKPENASDWVCGEPLSFIITVGGKRIFIAAGGIKGPLQPSLGRVDLAIIGVATEDARKCFRTTIDRLNPKYILPSHQDDFFIAPERGFHFGRTANMDEVLRDYTRPPTVKGQLILLRYFQSWPIPN